MVDGITGIDHHRLLGVAALEETESPSRRRGLAGAFNASRRFLRDEFA
jgi:hypothetical protein